MKINSIVCLLFLVTCNTLTAQNLSNKGREFWVGYGHHQFMEAGKGNSQEMVLYFSAEQAARVTVTIKGTGYREVYDVAANSVITSKPMPKGLESAEPSFIDSRLYTKDPSFPGGTGSEGLFSNKGIHIESDVPIVAYAHIYGGQSSGASMLMPVDTWGYSYTALNTRQYFGNSERTCFSWIYIVARQNNTRIRVVPSVDTRDGKPKNVPFEVIMQQGDIYQLVGNFITDEEGEDLTGTTVNSIANNIGECYPIAVFTGSSRTAITCTEAKEGSGDNILQQLFPYQAWGKRYLTTPTHVDADIKSRNMNVFRIAVKDPTTIVKKNGMQLFGLNGFYYEYQSNTADYIEADKPVLVAQYMPSASACGYRGLGDPELIYISPIEQSIQQTGFYRNDKEGINYNYLSVIIPDNGVKSLTIDGSQSFSHTYPHDNKPGYTVVVKRWPGGAAQCIVKSDSAFTAITYGLGGAESYGYNAGTLINNLNGIASIKNDYNHSDTANAYTCLNTPMKLSVLMRYKPTRMQWKLSRLDGIISPAVDVNVSSPVSTGTEMVNGIPYYRYTLPSSYTFLVEGVHNIPLFTTHPSVDVCNNTEQVQYQVQVIGALRTGFAIEYENCKSSELIRLNGGETFPDGSPVKQWEWSFSGTNAPVPVIGKQAGQTFNEGTYMVRLVAADGNGCIADTSKPFTLADRPAVPDFTADAAAVCEGTPIRLTEIASQEGVKQWYWNLGDGDGQTMLVNGTSVSKTYETSGRILVKHVVKFSDMCVSDTAYREVTVYAKPKIQIEFPRDCLAGDGKVQFTDKSIVPDGQTISRYSWNFGDPAATAANPNTSSEAHPTHVFSNGPVEIRYSVTTEMGCVSDTLMNAQFNLRPLFSYADPVQLPVCELANQHISVAHAIVTNGVPGTGIYSGNGVNTTGDFDPRAAGPGAHVVKYVFTTDAGCIDSAFSHIEVLSSPRASFALPEQSCQDALLNFTDQSTIVQVTGKTVEITRWDWDFGDGTGVHSIAGNGDNSNTYSNSGTYNISLTATSSEGCSSAPTTNQLVVHSLPVASFELPKVVCMPGGDAKFINTSTDPEGTALSAVWSFGDGSTSALDTHIYGLVANYNVAIIVTNAFGCSSSISKQLSSAAFSDRPKARFTTTPVICEGTEVRFTDQSTPATGSRLTGWSWNFSSAGSSVEKDPVVLFRQPGAYPVILVVSDENGCQSVAGEIPNIITVHPQPRIDAGTSQYVAEGTRVRLAATAKQPELLNLHWSPDFLFTGGSILSPEFLAMRDQKFTLTASDKSGFCTAMDTVSVFVLRPVKVPNVFSPNGDGINDQWQIPNLSTYTGCEVDVYNRYGQPVYRSKGYSTAWDGKINGNSAPVGTYYFIIDLKNGFGRLTGSVTIVR